MIAYKKHSAGELLETTNRAATAASFLGDAEKLALALHRLRRRKKMKPTMPFDQTYDLLMETEQFSDANRDWDLLGVVAAAESSRKDGASRDEIAVIYGRSVAALVFGEDAQSLRSPSEEVGIGEPAG